MALRRQLAAQDIYLKPILDLIPDTATEDQIYFYIWIQDEFIADRVPVPAYYNSKCVKILRNWIASEAIDASDFTSIHKLKPMAYKPVHFQDLFKFSTNRKIIFSKDTISKISQLTDIDTPNILCYMLDEIKGYPVYQQYALAVAYYMYIRDAYTNPQIFLNFVCDGPSPPSAEESIRTRWENWGSSRPKVHAPPAPTSANKQLITGSATSKINYKKKSQPAAKPVIKQVIEPVIKPVIKPVIEPVIHQVIHQVKPINYPVEQPMQRPIEGPIKELLRKDEQKKVPTVIRSGFSISRKNRRREDPELENQPIIREPVTAVQKTPQIDPKLTYRNEPRRETQRDINTARVAPTFRTRSNRYQPIEEEKKEIPDSKVSLTENLETMEDIHEDGREDGHGHEDVHEDGHGHEDVHEDDQRLPERYSVDNQPTDRSLDHRSLDHRLKYPHLSSRKSLHGPADVEGLRRIHIRKRMEEMQARLEQEVSRMDQERNRNTQLIRLQQRVEDEVTKKLSTIQEHLITIQSSQKREENLQEMVEDQLLQQLEIMQKRLIELELRKKNENNEQIFQETLDKLQKQIEESAREQDRLRKLLLEEKAAPIIVPVVPKLPEPEITVPGITIPGITIPEFISDAPADAQVEPQVKSQVKSQVESKKIFQSVNGEEWEEFPPIVKIPESIAEVVVPVFEMSDDQPLANPVTTPVVTPIATPVEPESVEEAAEKIVVEIAERRRPSRYKKK